MTIEQQAAEVRKVKKFEAGVVKDPITIDADATVRDLFDLTRLNNISGVPVLENGDWSASSPPVTCASKAAWTPRFVK